MFVGSLLIVFASGNVKKVMKNHSEEYGKKKETLPLEGGGNRVGMEGLTGIARDL
jgi:hypothetical protein